MLIFNNLSEQSHYCSIGKIQRNINEESLKNASIERIEYTGYQKIVIDNVCYDCLTVKNQWELLTGDDGVGLGEYKIYHQLGDLNRKVVIKQIQTPELLSKDDGKDGLGGLYTFVNCKLQCRRPLSEKQKPFSFNLCLTC